VTISQQHALADVRNLLAVGHEGAPFALEPLPAGYTPSTTTRGWLRSTAPTPPARPAPGDEDAYLPEIGDSDPDGTRHRSRTVAEGGCEWLQPGTRPDALWTAGQALLAHHANPDEPVGQLGDNLPTPAAASRQVPAP